MGVKVGTGVEGAVREGEVGVGDGITVRVGTRGGVATKLEVGLQAITKTHNPIIGKFLICCFIMNRMVGHY